MIEHVSKFLDFLDQRAVFRRAAFIVIMLMTWRITDWATAFAQSWLGSGKSGADVGIVIGAVTAPFATLQAVALKVYSDSRGS